MAGVQGGVSSLGGKLGKGLAGKKILGKLGGDGSGSVPLSSRSAPGAGLPTCFSRGHVPSLLPAQGQPGFASPGMGLCQPRCHVPTPGVSPPRPALLLTCSFVLYFNARAADVALDLPPGPEPAPL